MPLQSKLFISNTNLISNILYKFSVLFIITIKGNNFHKKIDAKKRIIFYYFRVLDLAECLLTEFKETLLFGALVAPTKINNQPLLAEDGED